MRCKNCGAYVFPWENVCCSCLRNIHDAEMAASQECANSDQQDSCEQKNDSRLESNDSLRENNDSQHESANDDDYDVRCNVETSGNVKIAFFLIGLFVCSIPSVCVLPFLAAVDVLGRDIMPDYLWDNEDIPTFVATIGFFVYAFLCRTMRSQAEKYKQQGEIGKSMALLSGIQFSFVWICLAFIAACVLRVVKPLLEL